MPPAARPELDQELRGEERAARFDRHALERRPREELAGAVDVTDRQPEEDPVGEPVQARVDGPDQRVGALDPVADDRVGVARLEPLDQPAEVGDLELAVAVGEREVVVACGGEAGPERGAVAEVRRVVDGADLGMRRGELVGDGRRVVLRAVVDDDDLERLGEAGQGRERLLDEPAEVRGLVVGREEVRQRRQARGAGRDRGRGHWTRRQDAA